MKRTIVASLLVTFMLLALAGCGSQAPAEQKQQATEPQQEQAEQPKAAEEQKSALAEKKTPFEKFEAALDERGETYEKVKMAAEYVGAVEGEKYMIADGTVELYLFDMSSEAYKLAKENQAVYLEGFGQFPAVVENGMALLVQNLDGDIYADVFHGINTEG